MPSAQEKAAQALAAGFDLIGPHKVSSISAACFIGTFF